MATINSVLGPVSTDDLGFTLTHEHLYSSSAGVRHTYPDLMDRQQVVEAAVEELSLARNEGVDTIVEVSTLDLGRDVLLIQEASRRSGVRVICATGSWLDIPRAFWDKSPDTIAALWAGEIEEGIEGTGIKAAIIKVSCSHSVTDPEDLMLRAAARAHLRTGAPITTHTEPNSRAGMDQIRIFEEEGVNLGRVSIGHVNSTLERDYLTAMLDKGAWLGMDQYWPGGPPDTPGWEERTEVLKGLIDDGYGDRIMVSHDFTPLHVNMPEWYPDRHQQPDGFLWITRNVLPRLRESGVSEEDIQKLTIANPRRFLAAGRE